MEVVFGRLRRRDGRVIPDARFQFHHQPLQYFQDLAPGTPAQKAHLQDYKDFVRDIQQNTLPQVVFYKPIGQFNQHPGYTNVTDGDRHLAELVGCCRKVPPTATC